MAATLLMALAIAVAGAAPDRAAPAAVWDIATLDLAEQTPPEDRYTTRYLDLSSRSPEERAGFTKIISYAANSTSWRSELGHPEIISDGLLLKIDLRAYSWDYSSRSARLLELERRGVKFPFKTADDRRLFLDPWEQLARLDPYFNVGRYDAQGVYVRGWLDPKTVNAARHLSRSLKFVVRADWVVGRLLLEKQFGGIYSDLLMFPPKEADVYKSFLIDIKAFERDNLLRQGGAVLESLVALHNRELQLIPSPYGQGSNRYYYQTFDFDADERGNKSVLEALAGTVKHQGRESIGSLPNGMLWYLLFSGAGDQAAVVPETIAQVKDTLKGLPIRETRVVNSYKCLQCHGPVNGIYPFEDVVRKTFLSKAAILKTKAYDSRQAYNLAELLEDYYSSTLGTTIRFQQEAYKDRIQACCGMTGAEAAVAVVGAVEGFQSDLVTPETAAREMGVPLELARLYWLAASDPKLAAEVSKQLGILPGTLHYCIPDHGNPQLAVLASGQPIRRAAWEQSFGDAMRAAAYPWESNKKAH